MHMRTRRFPALLGALVLLAGLAVRAQSPYLAADPAPDKAFPAAMDAFQIPSHGALLNGMAYVAPGAGPHPTVVLLHGFPGNEKNLDLAQAIRRAGWNVLYLDYRGSWGSPGEFSFSHCIEDAGAAVAWLRTPANAARLRTDPGHIVLVGHSMGGFVALEAGAADPAIQAVIAISAADMGASLAGNLPAEQREARIQATAKRLEAEGMAPLAGTSPRALAEEAIGHAAAWKFATLAPKLAGRPLLAITSDDGLAPAVETLVSALKKAGSPARSVHLATDHSYSDHRIALTEAVLAELRGK